MGKESDGERGRQNLRADQCELCWNKDREPLFHAIYFDSKEWATYHCLCRRSVLSPNRSFGCSSSRGIPYWSNSDSLHFGKPWEVCKSA